MLGKLLRAMFFQPWKVIKEGHPNGFEVRVSPDKSQIAVWEPGNEPWFVIDTSQVRGTWVKSRKMDALDWERYFALEDDFK